MWTFVKSFSTYRTTKKAPVISSTLIIDSLDAEASSAVVAGTEITPLDVGNWLIIDGLVYRISAVKPQTDRAQLTLVAPVDVFSRPLEYFEQSVGQTIGNYIAEQLEEHWIQCEDPAYAIPYLSVSGSDTSVFSAPELDSAGCYRLDEYARLMRRTYGTTLRFRDGGAALLCEISSPPETRRQISFDDGKSQLQTLDYSASGTAKLTVICDVDTGEKDDGGNAITYRQRSTWYLAEDGSASDSVPPRRATGEWTTITVSKPEDVETKVLETFAKNKTNHKLEFWSSMDLPVRCICTFFVYGVPITSDITLKRKSSSDNRYFYRCGELATTASEKLRGAIR